MLKKERSQNGYTEKHHIFPQSIFGPNKNIVALTAKEHYVAHHLIWKYYKKRYGSEHWKTIKMFDAYFRLSFSGTIKITSRNSEKLKILKSERMKKNNPAAKPEIKEKIRATMNSFGEDHWMKKEETVQKVKNTWTKEKREKRGAKTAAMGSNHPMKRQEILEKYFLGEKNSAFGRKR